MKAKIRKISLGRLLYVSITSRRVVIGRPHTRRHLTVEKRGTRFLGHLTDETLPTDSRSHHLFSVRLGLLEQFQARMEEVALSAFIDNLFPVTAEALSQEGFKLMTSKALGFDAIRMFVKPGIRPNLRIREPSEREFEELEERVTERLVDPDQLELFTTASPGTVSAMYLVDGQVADSFSLYYFPLGIPRSDGQILAPGWYGLGDRECISRAHTQVLLEHVGPKFFAKIERALRFLRFDPPFSAVEMEDVFRRHADGESIDEIRASRERNGAY